MVPRLCVGGVEALLVPFDTWKSLCTAPNPEHPCRLPFHHTVSLGEDGFLGTFFFLQKVYSVQATVIEHLLCTKCCIGHWGCGGWERADKSRKALVQCEGWDDSIAVGARGGAVSRLTPLE